MTSNAYYVALALILVSGSTAAAAPKRPVAPAALVSAKTIYLEKQTANPKAADRLLRGVRQWGRLKLVDAREKADVVASVGTADNPRRSPVSGPSAAASKDRKLTLTIRRANTSDVLWSDTGGSMDRLVDNLRAGIEPPPSICIAMWCR